MKHKGKVENNPLVSDRDSYKNVTDYLRVHPSKTHFVQMETIQNHMPYPGNYYSKNPFIATSTQGASTAELGNINTYSRGLQYTDVATREFLADLDELDEPTTVIWYGDHLPGIYANEIDQPNYALTMHETDYFIWSNKASKAASKKVGNKTGKGVKKSADKKQSALNTKIPNADFTSPNYFMAQAAQHMDAKVTPFIAFLTQAHEHVPAIQSPLETKLDTNWDKALADEPVYLSQTGYRINALDERQKQLVNDYKLITYDLTLCDHYLQKMGFTTQIPED